MKICVIAPVIPSGPRPASVEEFAHAARADCEVEVVYLDRGPASIESQYEEALAAPDIIAKAKEAEALGFDAVVVSCMGDPGVHAAREQLVIPVLGPAQVSMHLAATLCHRFSIVTVLDRLIPLLENLARVYGVSDNLASVLAIDIPVLDLESDTRRVTEALTHAAVDAVDRDHAHGIILGCTGMTGMAQAIRDGLVRRGYDVPVVDPGIAALKAAEVLVDMRLSHSKLTYPVPRPKLVHGYPAL